MNVVDIGTGFVYLTFIGRSDQFNHELSGHPGKKGIFACLTKSIAYILATRPCVAGTSELIRATYIFVHRVGVIGSLMGKQTIIFQLFV